MTIPERSNRRNPIRVAPDDGGPTSWPDVRGLSNVDAAEAYAKAGVPIVPVRPGTKNPGSYLGRGWPQLATTDLDTVRVRCRRWPEAGVAMHPGGGGLLVFDVDKPQNVPDWLWPLLKRAVFLPTRPDTEPTRGHYIYRQRPGDRFGNGLGKLKPPKDKKWGDIRGLGGGIVLAPTVHPETAEGGSYTAVDEQPVPYLPGELAEQLNAVADVSVHRSLTPGELDANAKLFLAEHTADREPYALATILDGFDPSPSGRHPSMWDSLCWALREGKAGRFPAQRAVDELQERWREAIGGDYRDGDPDEFHRMVRDAVCVADEDDASVLWDRAHRNRWPSPKTPQKVAKELLARVDRDGRPLAHWRGEWFCWGGKCWEPTSDDQIRRLLYQVLEKANYEHITKDATLEVAWNPDKAKVTNVVDALKAEALWPDEVEDGAWRDGRDCRVVAFANGLLRVADGKLLEHTPDYFNTAHLRCDYDPNASAETVSRFLGDLTDGDKAATETLLEFIGTRVAEDNRFQKMLVLQGASGSGKGTLDRLISELLGRRHTGYQMDDFKNNGFPLEPLLGKTLVTISDQRAQLNMKKFTDLLLQVVGGDAVTLRLPYAKRSVTQRLPLTFLILTNEIPMLPDNAGALRRRLLAVKTPNSFVGREDVDLDAKLAAELPGFANLVLAAYRRLVERGKFEQPDSGQEVLGLMRENSSYLANFIDECCAVGPDLVENKAVLYSRWRSWCTNNGHTPTASNKFASDLYSLDLGTAHQITHSKRTLDGERVPCYLGVKLKETGREPKWSAGA